MTYKIWSGLARALLILSLLNACVKPETIPDGAIGSVECDLTDPESCGEVACNQVHTNTTSIPPLHFDADTCGLTLIGQVFMDGAFLSELLTIVGDFCAENPNTCTYAEAQKVQTARVQLWRVRHPTPTP